MPVIDDRDLGAAPDGIEIVRRIGRRRFTHAVHDIDGTHSLIRDWPPVMSLVIHWAMTCGLRSDFDSAAHRDELVRRVGEKFDETDRFCEASAGLSALTQMEYGIRRAVELGSVSADSGLALSPEQKRINSAIVKRIWNGEERFGDVVEPAGLLAFIHQNTARLFKLYESVLNGACRDRNTAAAWKNPAQWRVPGSLEFMNYLHQIGCVNFFVTGAVLYENGGMLEEVRAVGFEVGAGKSVEAAIGSSWDRKLPKDEVMRQLFQDRGIKPEEVLVVGDGRSEIKAGAELGCVAFSRLPTDATRQRELHRQLGTHYILRDYTDPWLRKLIRAD